MGTAGDESETTTSQTIRYAPYVESQHELFLNLLGVKRDEVVELSPYANYSATTIDEDFFGVGYLISSFPSLYDMFGKYMAGLDIEGVWHKAVNAILSPVEIFDSIKEQKLQLDTKVETEVVPTFQRNMRDINAVTSSSFVVGMGMIDDARIKEIGKMSIDAVSRLLDNAEKEWYVHLNWSKSLVTTYAKLMKEYFSDKMATDEGHLKMYAKDKLWSLEVLDEERKGLQAIVPRTTQAKKLQASLMSSPAMKLVSIIAWTAQGAYIGSAYPPYGTIIGAVVGFIIGVALTFIE